MKPSVLITQTVPETALNRLKDSVEITYRNLKKPISVDDISVIGNHHQGIMSLLSDKLTSEFIDKFPNLKVISNFAVGYNNIDVQFAKNKNIWVTNTPNVLTDTTADLALALLLSLTRRIIPSDQYCREAKFSGWEVDLFLGPSLSGKNCGIIGLGSIGKAFAKRVQSLGMTVFYFNRKRLSLTEEKELQVHYLSLQDLLTTSTVISLHTPLNAESKHLMNKENMKLLRSDAIIINTARGELIDENELAVYLKENRIYGACLDVFEFEPKITEELKFLPNVIMTPHIGSATTETRNQMANLCADNILSVLFENKALTPV